MYSESSRLLCRNVTNLLQFQKDQERKEKRNGRQVRVWQAENPEQQQTRCQSRGDVSSHQVVTCKQWQASLFQVIENHLQTWMATLTRRNGNSSQINRGTQQVCLFLTGLKNAKTTNGSTSKAFLLQGQLKQFQTLLTLFRTQMFNLRCLYSSQQKVNTAHYFRNLNPPKLCSGILLPVKQLISHCLILRQIGLPFEFKQLQFKWGLAFVMTMNKGLSIASSWHDFFHGKLYVGSKNNLIFTRTRERNTNDL